MTAQAFAGIMGMAVAWFEEAVVQATAIGFWLESQTNLGGAGLPLVFNPG